MEAPVQATKGVRPEIRLPYLRENCSARRFRTGSFGSRLFEDGERLVAMFGEVLLALDGAVTAASMDGEGGVSQGGEGLGGVAGSGAAGVLAAGPIADVVQAVLDAPKPPPGVLAIGGGRGAARQGGGGGGGPHAFPSPVASAALR